jgi:hypothetical protein
MGTGAICPLARNALRIRTTSCDLPTAKAGMTIRPPLQDHGLHGLRKAALLVTTRAVGAVPVCPFADQYIGVRQRSNVKTLDGALVGHRDVSGVEQTSLRSSEKKHGGAEDVTGRKIADGEP